MKLEEYIKQHNIISKFEKIMARNDVTLLKPEPEGFTKLYNPNIPKKQYIMIGDSKADYQSAQHAGIDFFFINYFDKTKHIDNLTY